MFLKTLQIKGFKSFADTSSLDLEPGVTVVVGPNGSGKSNVVDAIGWVLGAQAPSAVRSQKMDDVIFAGTAKRPALGRAEVSLTIDNTSQMLPIDFTEVTITRVLFRSGDSEYQINGVPCRLLDIQELLSDSGVGRQQHVIISQGQIDAVLNARPEERRLIIEEAAGVLKFRRRREKAERRLNATEANLTRILDMLREVKRQRGPLERQADAARRYDSVATELHALRIHLAGREMVRLRAQLTATADERRELSHTEREVRAALAGLDAQILAIEAELSAEGAGELGDALVRYETLRERSRGLAAVLAERGRGVERDREAFVDEAVVASLAVEQAELADETATLDSRLAELQAEDAEVAAAEAELDRLLVAFEASASAPGERHATPAAEVRGELAAIDAMAERFASDLAALDGRRAQVSARVERFDAERRALRETLTDAPGRRGAATDEIAAAHADLDAAVARHDRADRRVKESAADHQRWSARAEALQQALDAAHAEAGLAHVAGIEGVLGTLRDLVEIDGGFEEALDAALPDALGAIVAADAASGRHALERLAAADAAGAVIALGVEGVARRAGPTTDATHLRGRVRGSSRAVEALLDVLLDDVHVTDGDWVVALDLALRLPGAVVVSRSGARLSPRGWRLGAAGSGATAAALDEAVAASARSADEAERAAVSLAEAVNVLDSARARHQAAIDASTLLEVELERNAEAATRFERDLADARAELDEVSRHHAEMQERMSGSAARRTELFQRLPSLETAEATAAAEARTRLAERRELDDRVAAVAARRADLDVRLAEISGRRRLVGERTAQVLERLGRHEDEREVAQQRHRVLGIRAELTARLIAIVAQRSTRIDAVLGGLREHRRLQNERNRAVSERLDALRSERSARERTLEELRERRQRGEVDDARIRTLIEGATATIRTELDCEPDTAIAAPQPELPDGVSAPARVRELERDLRSMGAINPLALEEFAALTERIGFLESQLDDIRQSRRELTKVITRIDAEIVDVFASAFADVATNFDHLFQTLFPGGSGRLILTEPGDLLNTGLEIEARPSGKNVRKLSLLSGGERSLTALAYLFAVFRSRPSPFYVMDEVEAALDDVNLHRFLGLVAEFRNDAQLLIVSHQKRTMEAADVLYGVTMEPGGSSKVVSERVGASVD